MDSKMMRLILVLVISLTACATPSEAGISPAGNQDILSKDFPAFSFQEIWHYTEIYKMMRFEPVSNTRQKLPQYYPESKVVEIVPTKNLYLIGTIPQAKKQEIIIRGTANFKNALLDIEYSKVMDKKLGIYLHKGFRKSAWAVYQDVKQYLRPGYRITLCGQSLGAAEALIVAFYLIDDGYDVEKVLDFGQPKVTDWQGIQKFKDINLIRIVDENDIVPLVPPSNVRYKKNPYRHLGPEMILLDGPYFCLLDERTVEQQRVTDFWANLKNEAFKSELKEHLFPSYIAHLKPKLEKAILVPYADRKKYLSK